MRLLLSIGGAFAAIVCIASAAVAQRNPTISVHTKHLRTSTSTQQSDFRGLASPPTEIPRDPRTWVGDPAGRPYVYVPGMASGGN
jgi:hypothetical protein